MISPTPGLIAQMTGTPTHNRYNSATIYVDVATRFSYITLQTTTSADETIQGKEAFEREMMEHGYPVMSYHADNGIFAANKWRNHCRQKGQRLTFAGINAHHQNGIAERKIRDIQEMARSMLVHAKDRWPEAITANLWPYAARMAVDTHNNMPSLQHEEHLSPWQQLTNASINPNPKHWNTFGAPAYVLQRQLQEI